MTPLPAAARRLVVAVAVLIALVAPSVITLWTNTPSVADVQARVADRTSSYGVPLLSPNQVPGQLSKAVVAIEDERFYAHHGIDSLGLARAVVYDAVNLCLCQGGSTITEQLVKDLYLGGSDRGYHKIEDMALALKVERVIDKDQIMADYLSEIPTGYGRYGVVAAACAYFRAPLANLTIGQYALLAGVGQAPSYYDPTINPDAARERRSEVIAALLADHEITAQQAAAADAEPVLDRGPNRPGC